ncbi:MAG: molecular chaperone [Chlamydiia bacterium]|nr:molecular chaperone [Chlamydiia bacterium]
MKLRCASYVTAFCLVSSNGAAAGLAVAPMEQHVQGQQAATYVASNMDEKAIAVEVLVEEWTINEAGEEIRKPSADLVAYPRQFILKGSSAKNIKVGRRDRNAAIDKEKCYRVTIRELPISLEPEEPGTYHIYRASAYRTSYYVQPRRPDVQLEYVDSQLDGSSLVLRLVNAGNTHIHLQNPVLTLSYADGSKTEIRDKELLKPLAGENMHAQITRRFGIDVKGFQKKGTRITGGTLSFEDNGILEAQPVRFSL